MEDRDAEKAAKYVFRRKRERRFHAYKDIFFITWRHGEFWFGLAHGIPTVVVHKESREVVIVGVKSMIDEEHFAKVIDPFKLLG